MLSSDFPNEVNNDYCKREIEEIIENRDLTEDDKHAVLHRNAERFYGLKPLDWCIGVGVNSSQSFNREGGWHENLGYFRLYRHHNHTSYPATLI